MVIARKKVGLPLYAYVNSVTEWIQERWRRVKKGSGGGTGRDQESGGVDIAWHSELELERGHSQRRRSCMEMSEEAEQQRAGTADSLQMAQVTKPGEGTCGLHRTSWCGLAAIPDSFPPTTSNTRVVPHRHHFAIIGPSIPPMFSPPHPIPFLHVQSLSLSSSLVIHYLAQDDNKVHFHLTNIDRPRVPASHAVSVRHARIGGNVAHLCFSPSPHLYFGLGILTSLYDQNSPLEQLHTPSFCTSFDTENSSIVRREVTVGDAKPPPHVSRSRASAA
ncbi:hypothetical protein EDB85DRAFT_1899090 [Lactarius pseudohatsudake]|nr:hypothetical protein EDB85DRAFT_1899090 [Lactarius pseudohatsudake]